MNNTNNTNNMNNTGNAGNKNNPVNHTENVKVRLSSSELQNIARSGLNGDINFLMGNLEGNPSFLNCMLIDNALGQVTTGEGQARIRYFLFNGNRIQRNYAALYFKRKGNTGVLEEAINNGCIDHIQAYSR